MHLVTTYQTLDTLSISSFSFHFPILNIFSVFFFKHHCNNVLFHYQKQEYAYLHYVHQRSVWRLWRTKNPRVRVNPRVRIFLTFLTPDSDSASKNLSESIFKPFGGRS